MAHFKRREKTGTHRVKIPGTGWLTVKPGQPVVDAKGDYVDCDPSVFGSEAVNYTPIGGNVVVIAKEEEKVPQAAYVLQARKGGAFYDVVNPANPSKPVNDKALRKAEAEALLEKLLGEKPDSQKEDTTEFSDEDDVGAGEHEHDIALVCPYEDDGFGKVFDSFQECDDCPINAQCKAAQEEVE